MAAMELLLVTSTPSLDTALNGYEGLRIVTGPTLNFALRMVASEHPPDAVYVDDTRGTVEELWSLVRTCEVARTPIFIGLAGPALAQQADFRDAGLTIATETTVRMSTELVRWLSQQLGLRKRASAHGQALLAVAGAKGGIGKTLVVALLAEALHRRGLRVLVVDGDLSNSGVVPTFRIPSGFPSYLMARADGPGAWTPENIRRYIYRHQRSGLSFLLGSEETADAQDLVLPEWQALMQAVRALDEFDVVLVDTGPEIKKRPYGLLVAHDGGKVILPVPPGRKERTGAGNALRVFQTDGVDLTDRCLLLFMDPENGASVSTDAIMPRFAQHFPKAQILGRLPRAPKQVSLADEEVDAYISPLDVAPYSKFTRAVYQLAEDTCQALGVTPPLPMPRLKLWQRMWGEQMTRQPADILKRPAVLND